MKLTQYSPGNRKKVDAGLEQFGCRQLERGGDWVGHRWVLRDWWAGVENGRRRGLMEGESDTRSRRVTF
jgi:hypothetical protein